MASGLSCCDFDKVQFKTGVYSIFCAVNMSRVRPLSTYPQTFFLDQLRHLGKAILGKCLISTSFNLLKTTCLRGTLVKQSGKTKEDERSWRVHSESRVKPQYLTCGHAASDAWFTRKHTGRSLAITVCANCNSHCTETYKHTPIFVYVIKRLALENISLLYFEYQSKYDSLWELLTVRWNIK